MQKRDIPAETERCARAVVNAAFRVHSALGPGLLESVYEKCLCYELQKGRLRFRTQVVQDISYGEMVIKGGLRLDLVVENCLVVELKAVEGLLPVHEAQLLTYLKLSGHRLGLLLNFNVPIMKSGIRRLIL